MAGWGLLLCTSIHLCVAVGQRGGEPASWRWNEKRHRRRMAVDQQRRRAGSNPAMHGELAPFCLSRGFGAGSARRRSAVLPHRLALTGEARVHGLTRHPRGLIALRWTGGNLLHNIAHKIPGSERSASSTIRPTRCFCCGLIAAARALSPNFCSLSLRRSELTRILLGLGARPSSYALACRRRRVEGLRRESVAPFRAV